VGVLSAILAALTVARPLSEPVTLPVQNKIPLTSSRAAMVWGAIVVVATIGLYGVFY
jgi:hypothetical protein